MGEFSDLHTNHAKDRNSQEIAAKGFEQWYESYARKAALLTVALERYNDGRMKRYLCELFIQQEIEVLENIMRKAESLTGTPKEIGKAFKKIAENEVIG